MSPTSASAPHAPRAAAVDLLRGFTVAGMIVVNNPGNWSSVFSPFRHSDWNGVSFADLIFPAFIFIMGVSLSLTRRPAPDAGVWQRYRRVTIRTLTLVGLGLVLNAAAVSPALANMRIPGVLQRIGVTYFVAAAIVLNTSERRQWHVALGLLVAHSALLVLPQGVFTARAFAPDGNTAVLIDRWFFGTHTLTPAGDPEGVLGLLTCVSTALFGASAGRWLVRDARRAAADAGTERWTPLARLTVAGAAAVLVGYAWSFALPLNKPLWTASFSVFTSGVAALGLVVFTRFARSEGEILLVPFDWLGTNPLAIYFLSELVGDLLQRAWLVQSGHSVAPKDLIYWSWLAPLTGDNGGPASSLLYAVGYMLVWMGVAGVMRWRGVRFRA